ncbi:signal peptidase I [Clostridium formicaceticum]|uniref:Signal peptidase I n=1 Tax=Clostridium formicaceticum TaxID=1497 RepID=A0AAC9RRI2_9CLOT|nr:signal peptidase I [Clostridium formicaceticum]AOY74538.1 signal peptidase I [Clostridium formicaceticum]ARE88895.1 Signal peptidase I S [Clostridium formicaceticum]
MKSERIIKEILEWGKILLFSLVASIFLSAFILQPSIVCEASMEPTLEGKSSFDVNKAGDYVMIFKSAYILGNEPEYGDIVIIDSRVNRQRTLKDKVIDNPLIRRAMNDTNDRQFWIKRVIGEAGDLLEFKEGTVYRNGIALEEDYIKEDMMKAFETIKVPENHVFVMGDNRNISIDSREIGSVPVENVLGKVIFRFYPFNKISIY